MAEMTKYMYGAIGKNQATRCSINEAPSVMPLRSTL